MNNDDRDLELTKLKSSFLGRFQELYGTVPEETKERVLSINTEQMLALKKRGEAEQVYDCDACKDGKKIRLSSDPSNAYFGKSFSCPKCTTIEELVYATGVPTGYAKWNLSQLDIGSDFIASCVQNLTDGDSIVMYGKVGRGKTHTAIGLLREWIRADGITKGKFKPAKFIYFPQFLDDMRQSFGDDSNQKQAQQYETDLASYELLVVDDLGAESTTQWVIERVNVLLDRRLRNNKQTIVTTNLMNLGDVSKRYGERAASRLGGYRWSECIGKDFRLAQ
tara:strand:- start:2144 stop:2980 length:837 start_codon:yes stop_codon:yes gene_type:complete